MSVDAAAFRRTAGHFATGVTVVAVADGGGVHAMTANAFTSVSLDPLLVLVALARRGRMAGLLERATGFTVNVLREDQGALSTFFAGAWRDAEPPPFRFMPWQGLPRLEGCAAAFGCEVAERLPGGDHWLVLGRVVALHEGLEPHHPLIFHRGRYRALAREAGSAAPELEDGDGVPEPAHVYYEPW